MKVIGFHPDADAEVTEAAQYYEIRQIGLGSDLLAEVERGLNQILMNTEATPKIGKRLRRKSLWRFPYNLVYTVYPDRIQILACAHQKRRPYYWRKRLK
ncbi:MAG: type II toxin-antitoxin system RelE/ParE family toxin [Chlorobium sp.]